MSETPDMHDQPGTFAGIPIKTDPTLPRDSFYFTSDPGTIHSFTRDLFIEKGHTMNDQTEINLSFDPDRALGGDKEFWEARATRALGRVAHAPASRHTDPSTSYMAASSVQGTMGIRERVWQILRSNPDGLTHEQLIEAYRYSVDTYDWPPAAPQSIRSRTKELERDGMVRHNERPTDKTRAGRLTHRWFAITDPAEQRRRRELAESTAGPTPEQARDLVGDLANDIQESRRVGAFMAREMAQYLVDKGWTRPNVTNE